MEPPETEVIGGFELPYVGGRKLTLIFWKTNMHSLSVNHLFRFWNRLYIKKNKEWLVTSITSMLLLQQWAFLARTIVIVAQGLLIISLLSQCT